MLIDFSDNAPAPEPTKPSKWHFSFHLNLCDYLLEHRAYFSELRQVLVHVQATTLLILRNQLR